MRRNLINTSKIEFKNVHAVHDACTQLVGMCMAKFLQSWLTTTGLHQMWLCLDQLVECTCESSQAAPSLNILAQARKSALFESSQWLQLNFLQRIRFGSPARSSFRVCQCLQLYYLQRLPLWFASAKFFSECDCGLVTCCHHGLHDGR